MDDLNSSGSFLNDQGDRRYVYRITAVAALGGLLFGFDTAVIAGAIGAVNSEFSLSASYKGWFGVFQQGWAVGCAIIGCMIGVAFAGFVSDKFGRKKGMLIAAVLLTIASVATALPRNFTQFVIARMIGGVGVGVASMLSPIYIAEISPPKIRGRLVAINQLAIIFGMLVTSTVNFSLQQSFGSAEAAWRWMFGSQAVPSVIFFLAIFFIPESPRWLIEQGMLDKAKEILSKIGGKSHARSELQEIENAVSAEPSHILEIFKPGLRKALLIGVLLAIFTQITGINTILYYTTEVLKSTGDTESQAFLKTILVNAVNVIFSILAVCYIDKIGRKSILLIALGGMAVFLACLGATFLFGDISPMISCITLLCYVAFFMFGLGPGFWTLVSEIYPTRIRGRALSIVTWVLWGSTYFVSQTYPMLLKAVGPSWTFWIYGMMSVVGYLFVLAAVPETKEKTLEEIETYWK